MAPFWKFILILSLLVNAWLGFRYLSNNRPTPPQVTAPKGGGITIDTENFDFSNTSLSDEAWKVPPPETAPAEPSADPLKGLDDLNLLPKPANKP